LRSLPPTRVHQAGDRRVTPARVAAVPVSIVAAVQRDHPYFSLDK
jgi:hypothetical protein